MEEMKLSIRAERSSIIQEMRLQLTNQEYRIDQILTENQVLQATVEDLEVRVDELEARLEYVEAVTRKDGNAFYDCFLAPLHM